MNIIETDLLLLASRLVGWLDFWSANIPVPMALAAVALIGYLFGQRTRRDEAAETEQARRELRRAKSVARQLEHIVESVRKDLATHQASVAKFKGRIGKLGDDGTDANWQQLCKEAEEMLKPTLKLAMQMSTAYDEIRQQGTQLMTFTEVRTDPLTGVSNRRALDETLDNMFAMLERYSNPFCLAIFDIDHFKQINDHQGHLHGDRTLQKVARLLDETARETDIVARYGGEEFVVVMPNTTLDGACIFAERVRRVIRDRLPLTISGGLAAAGQTDSPQTLLSRADSALYSAKACGRDRIFRHDGSDIEAIARAEEEADADPVQYPAEQACADASAGA